QHPVDSTYPYYVFAPRFEHYRNRRLNKRLSEMRRISIEDMKALQFDSFHLHAAEAVPVLLNLLLVEPVSFSSAEKELIQELQKWNFYTSPRQPEPPLFAEWWSSLEKLLWGRWKEEGRPILFPNSY